MALVDDCLDRWLRPDIEQQFRGGPVENERAL
jgi:hypothetical protein